VKIRNGFVSNSSSSSFVLCFKKKPKNVSEIKEIIWPREENIFSDSGFLSVWQAAVSVFEQISDKKPLTIKDMERFFEGSWDVNNEVEAIIGGKPNYDAPEDVWQKYYKELHKKTKKEAKKLAKEFMKEHKKHKMFSVGYSDHDGPFNSTMEHGDVFSNIEHVRFSHH